MEFYMALTSLVSLAGMRKNLNGFIVSPLNASITTPTPNGTTGYNYYKFIDTTAAVKTLTFIKVPPTGVQLQILCIAGGGNAGLNYDAGGGGGWGYVRTNNYNYFGYNINNNCWW